MKHAHIETRSAMLIETREDPADTGADADLAAAIAEVRNLAGVHTAFEARITEKLAAVTARLDAEEVRAQRPGATRQAGSDGEVETRAFMAFVRTGDPAEIRALNASSVGGGGVFVPETVSSTIIERVTEFSPIRALAQKVTLTNGGIKFPTLTDDTDADPEAVPEVGTDSRTEGEPEFGSVALILAEMAKIIPISRVLLQDSAVDLTGYIANFMGLRMGRKESRWFLKGSGTGNEPLGILNDASVGAIEAAGSTLSGDDVIDLFYSISSTYSARGTFLANRKSMAALRKLKDSTGQYLFQPALSASTPPTLHGRPLLEAPELDDPLSGKTPLLFGDFGSGFMIGDGVGMEMIRDDLTGWKDGVTKFNFARRTGGAVVLGEAIAKLLLR